MNPTNPTVLQPATPPPPFQIFLRGVLHAKPCEFYSQGYPAASAEELTFKIAGKLNPELKPPETPNFKPLE